MWPRACFALMLPVGLELTALGNVYPVDRGLRVAFWAVAALWFVSLALRARDRDGDGHKGLGYAEIALEALAGMVFVVYGLNSLATGAPIVDPWFATAKLFLVGVALWTLIAIDLRISGRAGWLLDEIELDGSTPENEEALARERQSHHDGDGDPLRLHGSGKRVSRRRNDELTRTAASKSIAL